MTSEPSTNAEDNTLTAFVVSCAGGADCTVSRVVAVTRQGVSAQDSTVRAFVVGREGIVLVLGGFDCAAAEHSLDSGGQL